MWYYSRNPVVTISSFDRPNLFLAVGEKKGVVWTDLSPLMKKTDNKYHFEGSTIIYCLTRKETDEVNNVMQSKYTLIIIIYRDISVSHSLRKKYKIGKC